MLDKVQFNYSDSMDMDKPTFNQNAIISRPLIFCHENKGCCTFRSMTLWIIDVSVAVGD